ATAQDIKPARADVAPNTVTADAVTPALRGLKEDERVDCSFVGPAVAQSIYIKSVNPPAGMGIPGQPGYIVLVAHSVATNKIYKELVAQWVTKNITSAEIIKRGKDSGVAHLPTLPFTGPNDERVVCTFYNGLWTQMIKTCYYKSLEKDYKSVAALLMQGFADGAFDFDIDAVDFPEICFPYDVPWPTQAPTRQPTN
ncbi:hypothetical protein ACHAW5_003804, partial [Stephanodiscus triporus]